MQLTGSNEIYFFPSAYRRAIKYGHIDPANEILRTEVLSVLQDPEAPFVIVSYPDALAEKVISRDDLKKNTLKISVGEKLDNMFVSDVLDEYGFEQVDYVYEPGQYALRGSILDVFSFSYVFDGPAVSGREKVNLIASGQLHQVVIEVAGFFLVVEYAHIVAPSF